MQINTKFNIGDSVFYLTQNYIKDEGECKYCNRPFWGHYEGWNAIKVRIVDLRVSVGNNNDIVYYVEGTQNGEFSEEELYATEEDALLAAERNS
jgi:hypothetical protein